MTHDVSAISAQNITKTFGALRAVNDLSVEVGRGEIVSLLGKNGAGKTTLIDIVLGLQRPTSGVAKLFGMTPREAIRRSLVGVIHQTGALLSTYTVAEILKLFASTHPRALDIEQVMDQTNLTPLKKSKIYKLSGGEEQRVRLALALLPDPELLILDEPTAGMDATARREFWDLMHHQADQGRTIIFATHYLAEAEDYAQRTVIMKDGAIIADAPPEELRRSNTIRHLTITVPQEYVDSASRALKEQRRSGEMTMTWEPHNGDTGVTRLRLRAPEVDDYARTLLSIPGAHNLEISTSSLEDVFTQITA
ncbi:MAG: ABC transporter ATP-binding protein [Actinomycetaceae bacterium]|nr:ABC transporter ATP-binding protein [Actinomycetaceae bacterium]